VSSIAGTTRDRRECWGRIGGTEFTLMDTAGVDGDRIQLLSKSKTTSKHAVERAMMEQTLEAAKQSDLVLLLWDAKVGVTQDLEVTARWLRKLGKDSNVAILANKLEGDSWAYDGSPVREHLDDINRLGLGDAIPISALQGDGMADIGILVEQLKAQKLEESGYDRDRVEETMSALEAEGDDEEKPLQMAVLGRQNVGKSTLVNTLLKSERVLTGPTPGLTRDAIAVEWTWKDKPIQLVDTAGIRKMTRRLDDSIEDMSVADALRAMKVAEVAVLVLDAEALFLHRQELAICNAVIEEGRALVIAANKMDLLEMSSKYTPQDFANGVQEQLEQRIPILRNTPVVPMSCLSGEGIDNLLPVVLDARDRWARTISTGLLNRWLKEVVDGARTPMVKGIPAKLKYIIQTKGRPPTFIIFSNVDELPDAYLRYLTKHFQESFELYGMPVRIIVQKSAKQNPYDKEKKQRSGFGLGGRDARQRRRVQGYIAKRKKVRKTN
jgi:GTP-binding protein